MTSLIGAFLILSGAFAAQLKVCEAGMSTPAMKFIRLIPSGLKEGSITPESLRWMIEQRQPANPIQDSRDVDNLSRRNALAREIPHITRQQWKLVVARAVEIEREHLKQLDQVEEAKKETKNIWGLIPLKSKFAKDELAFPQFTSRTGEIFIVTSRGKHSYIHNFTRGTKIKIPGQSASSDNYDFFETASGDLLFTLVSSAKITVHNARTADRLAFIDLSGKPAWHGSRPLMFERNGDLFVTVGHPAGGTFETNAHSSTNIFRLRADKSNPELERFRKNVVRFDDGQVYTYTFEQDLGKFKYTLNNMSTGQPVYDSPLTPHSFHDKQSVLIDDRGPKLIFKGLNPDSQAQLFTPQGWRFEPFDFPAWRSVFPLLISNRGELLAVEIYNGASEFSLSIGKISDLRPFRVKFDTDPDTQMYTQDLHVVPTPDDTFILAWQRDSENELTKMFVYSVAKRTVIPLSLPPNFVRYRSAFYNPADGRILLLGGELATQVYQLYGPDGSRP